MLFMLPILILLFTIVVTACFVLPSYIISGIKSSALLLTYEHVLYNNHIATLYKSCCRLYFRTKKILKIGTKPDSTSNNKTITKISSKLPYMKPYSVINEYTVIVLACNPGSYTLQGILAFFFCIFVASNVLYIV